MANPANSPLDQLWTEYRLVFRDFDDMTLARWMCQTLGQFQGRIWRLSHPLLGTYRLAAQLGYERQVWLKRLATPPSSYPESSCCRAPLLPLFTRDVLDSGLICQHCAETAVPLDELPPPLQQGIRLWADEYAATHAVAHWDESKQRTVADYEQSFEAAATRAEHLLVTANSTILPQLLDIYPAVIWEDQDECLEVRPEDIELQ